MAPAAIQITKGGARSASYSAQDGRDRSSTLASHAGGLVKGIDRV